MKPRVAVLVLNYNGLNWLKRCLPSVFRTEYANFEVWVIDNGSTDGSIDFVRTTQPNARILQFEKNLGFAEAYNRAITHVQADYVVLLNNDTIVLNPDWISRLLETAEADGRIAGVQCKLVLMKDQTRLDSVGGMGIKYWLGFTDIGKLAVDTGQYDNPPVAPFYLCAAGALISRRAFLTVGGFDAQYFAYVEDVDLCWRLRLAGYLIAYQPAAKVAHFWQGSSNQSVDWRTYMQRRNLLRTIMKNCGSTTICWAVRNYIVHSILLALAFAIMRTKKNTRINQSFAWNITQFPDTYRQRRHDPIKTKILEELHYALMYPPIQNNSLQKKRLHHTLSIIFNRRHDQVDN